MAPTAGLRLSRESSKLDSQDIEVPAHDFWTQSYSGDGRLLAIGLGDSGVRVFETDTGKLFSRPSTSDFITRAAFTGDGTLLALAGIRGVRVYESQTGRMIARQSFSTPTSGPGRHRLESLSNPATWRELVCSRNGKIIAAIPEVDGSGMDEGRV